MDQISLDILFNRMTSSLNIIQIAKFAGQVKHYTSDQPFSNYKMHYCYVNTTPLAVIFLVFLVEMRTYN